MAISDELIAAAARTIAGVEQVQADATAIIEDAFLLSLAFTDEDDYLSAVANTIRALEQIVAQSVTPAQLKHGHRGWSCYHFQHKVEQGARADMRIVFKRTEEGVQLRAYGHRNLPIDFYERVARTR